MQTEIEAKFLDISPASFRKVLKNLNATLVHKERLMRRRVFEHPTQKQNDWIRVRDEGDKITMSYKRLVDRTLHGTKEVTITVDDFENACQILEESKLKSVAYQETKREKWILDGSEITIDTWPWIPTFIEVESVSEKKIKDVCKKLGLKWEDALHGSVENVYQKHYNVTEEEVDDWPEIIFIPVPVWLRKKKR